MSDFTEELKEKLKDLIDQKIFYEDDDFVKKFERIDFSTTYEDAYEYAMRYGEKVAEAIQQLGVDEWLYGTAMEVWEPAFQDMIYEINEKCRRIQTNKNAIEHIGIAPQIAEYNSYDMREVVKKLTTSPDLGTNIKEYLDSIVDETKKSYEAKYANVITNYANKHVDKNMRKNMNFLMNSGIPVRVTRIYDGVGLHTNRKPIVCAWCKSKEGTFKFHNVTEAGDSGVFARHEGCGCKIDYDNRMTGTRTTILREVEWENTETIENTYESDKISVNKVISGHSTTPKVYYPFSIVDHVNENGIVDTRSFYDANGMKERDIHTTNHGNSKHHNFGINGEHGHDYSWDEAGKLKDKTTRELTKKERKENEDIL